MNIEIISCLNDNYSYLIHDNQSNTVAIIDPSEFAPCDKIISKKYKKLDYILNTHHHYDHVGGNKELKKKYNSKILGFKSDEERIPNIDKLLEDNEEFNIGRHKVYYFIYSWSYCRPYRFLFKNRKSNIYWRYIIFYGMWPSF